MTQVRVTLGEPDGKSPTGYSDLDLTVEELERLERWQRYWDRKESQRQWRSAWLNGR
jgi:hypothetical protein